MNTTQKIEVVFFYTLVRCVHPAQQHGRRFPFWTSSTSLFMCAILVDSFLTEVTQQIHSFLASGVREFQSVRIFGLVSKICCMSNGVLWSFWVEDVFFMDAKLGSQTFFDEKTRRFSIIHFGLIYTQFKLTSPRLFEYLNVSFKTQHTFFWIVPKCRICRLINRLGYFFNILT